MSVDLNNISSDQPQLPKKAQLVCFENQGQSLLGIIVAQQDGKKVTVLDEFNKTNQLIQERLSIIGEIDIVSVSFSEEIKKLRNSITTIKFDLEHLWSLCPSDRTEFNLAELLDLLGLPQDIKQLLALRLQLAGDITHFKRIQQKFKPRSQDEIEKRKVESQTIKQYENLQRDLIKAAKAKILDPGIQFTPEQLMALRPLAQMAAQSLHLGPEERRSAQSLFRRLKTELGLSLEGPPEKQAYSLLHKLGVFNASTNLALIRYDADMPFTNEQLAAVEELLKNLSNLATENEYLDLTHLACITIDDQSTKDMDDALSLEKTGTGYTLGIHISNLADFIKPNSVLDQLASWRASSIYLPDGVLHMFPEAVACNALSLVEGQIRSTLSLLVQLNDDFSIEGFKIVPTQIKVTKRYDYDFVDKFLHAETTHQNEDLLNFYSIACTLEAKRLEQGGFKVPKRDASIKIQPDGNLTIEELDEHSPARSLVGEMMILANNLMAEFAVKNNLPLIFRSQPEPDPNKLNLGDNLPPGLAQDYAMRFALKPSFTGIKALPHSTLGLNAYAQVTSPIRRYGDLCNQRQILNFIRSNQALYSSKQMLAILSKLDQAHALANKAQREGQRFWYLKYLQQRKKSKPDIWGTVIRCDGNLPLVQLDEIYITTLCRLPKGVKSGDRINLHINRVSPAFGELELVQS